MNIRYRNWSLLAEASSIELLKTRLWFRNLRINLLVINFFHCFINSEFSMSWFFYASVWKSLILSFLLCFFSFFFFADYCSVLEGDDSYNCWQAYFELKDLEVSAIFWLWIFWFIDNYTIFRVWWVVGNWDFLCCLIMTTDKIWTISQTTIWLKLQIM